MEPTREQLEKWERALEMIGRDAPGPIYNTFIKTLRLVKVLDDEIWFEAQTRFAIDTLYNRHMAVIENDINIVFGRELLVKLLLPEEIERENEKLRPVISPRYTFDNIIVGPFNSMAYHASVAIADNPRAQSYNPFFIYGGVGLGKTHMISAIANYILENDPDVRVSYLTAETFMNEFIDNVTHKRDMRPMRERMRSANVFIVDDIQFLANTNATQEAFFHTFNDLYNAGAQIIITSDRPPREISTLEERLRTRFEQGLIVDIRKPDFEHRCAILKRKAEADGMICDDEVIRFIASNVTDNIRTLEGALNVLEARKDLTGVQISVDTCRETLGAYISSGGGAALSPARVISGIADHYNVTRDDLLGSRRTRDVTFPRQVCMYALSRLLQMSTTAIGQELGNRDHTTVMHGIEKIKRGMEDDAVLRRNIDELIEEIGGR